MVVIKGKVRSQRDRTLTKKTGFLTKFAGCKLYIFLGKPGF
ncbi:hypothetical protein [Microcoleus sp.]